MDKGYTIFFTGLSGSGKSTIANALVKYIPDVIILDGDVIRKGLNNDLGFSALDRIENIRRVIELCKLLNSVGKNVISAFICPFEKLRLKAKKEIERCILVYCECSLNICEYRDPKGLYKLARAGKIKEFTGIDSPFEKPSSEADIVLNTVDYTVDFCCSEILNYIKKHTTDKYLVFIGRWVTFHDGHKYIMRKKYDEKKLPLLILIRDTHEETSAAERKNIIIDWCKLENIRAKAMIIPDIEGVYYGRGVGYNIEQIDVPENVGSISGTSIRKELNNE